MSQHDEMFAAGVEQLLDQLGTSVVHWPGGRQTLAAPITAIFDEIESEAAVDDPARRSVQRRAYLDLPVSITVTASELPRDRDVFIIAGEHWRAVKIIATDKAAGCLRTLLIERTESISTSKGGA